MCGPSSTDVVKKTKKKPNATASVGETLSFVWGCGPKTSALFCLGILGGIGNGLVYPMLAYLFSNSFVDISASTEGSSALDGIREVAFLFLAVGSFALFAAGCQTFFLEIAAHHACQSLRLQWFQALLRQDSAFFDVHDIGGVAASLGPSAIKYQRGIGRKFGDGVQFFTTG